MSCRATERVLTSLIAALLVLTCAAPADALGVDPDTSYGQPTSALVMPYDVQDRDTRLLISGATLVGGGGSQVSTHWSFWNAKGEALADISICLTPSDTVAVNPRNLQSLDADNVGLGPTINLDGNRGFVTVTAYSTDENCSAGTDTGQNLAAEVLIGSFSIFDPTTGASLANMALGFNADETGSFVNLPDTFLTLSNLGMLSIQTFAPDSLTSSLVVFLALKEQAGVGPWTKELGPLRKRVRANSIYHGDLGSFTISLPDLTFKTSRFTRIEPGDGSLIPGTLSVDSNGLLRFERFRYGASESEVGLNTWVYAFVGGAIGGSQFQGFGRYIRG